ncbi:MAG: DNA/RNA non-specific endonuclease [Nocardioides sp.]|uniref:DNA/RNA non-specific endonuclease n=1 Tax=Nocardioides sp. TaxID=35761 RepID=UPI0039E3344D
MAMCSINITEMTSLQAGLVKAEDTTRDMKTGLTNRLSQLSLDTGSLSPVGGVTSWVEDRLVDVRRRLAMAQAIAASTPGMGNYVQFNENAISTLTPAQAKAQAAAAAKALKSGDTSTLVKILDKQGYDPYFAHALAQQVSPVDLENIVMDQQGYGQLKGGVSKGDYEHLLTSLASTFSLASRGTGDLDLGPTWRDEFLQEMTAPKFRGDTNDSDAYRDLDQREAARSALLLIFERGQWSTPFLKDATRRIATMDSRGMVPWTTPGSGYEWAIEPNGTRNYAQDPVKSLMLALAHNPAAAKWAFTQGDTSTVSLGGDDVPVNGFLHQVLLEHRWVNDSDSSVAMLALQAAINGDKTSPIALDVQTISDSLAEQKKKWDETPWYKKWGHTILDVIGMIPVIGDVANVPNAAWYALEGDWADAGVTAAGMIPMLGDAALGSRVAVDLAKGGKLLKTMRMIDVMGKDGTELTESLKALQKAEQIEPAIFKFDDLEDFQRAANVPHPNVTYEFQGIRYTTDDLGRPIKVEGTPLKTKGASDPKLRQEIGSGPDADADDVGFHLFAESFGGPTNKLNVVPGNGKVTEANFEEFKNLNTSEYAKMENKVRAALNDPDVKDLNLKVEPIYGDATTRPSHFLAEVNIDGQTKSFRFDNVPVRR